jgi:hypothetical protein
MFGWAVGLRHEIACTRVGDRRRSAGSPNRASSQDLHIACCFPATLTRVHIMCSRHDRFRPAFAHIHSIEPFSAERETPQWRYPASSLGETARNV